MEKRYCILYVDDEETNLRVFNSIFRRYYQVLTASSGAEGLEILRKEEVQLIVTDQRMPKMTGLEFLGEAMKINPEAIRIVLTAYSDADTTIKGINEYGIYRYLIKPWVKSEMRLTIERALETWQLKQDKQALIEELKAVNARLESKVEDRTQNLLATNRALRQAKERLEEASETRELFLSTITHEMRNPLNVIVQATHLLQQAEDHQTRQQQIDVLRFSSETLLSLINDLLDISKIKAGKLEFEQVHFDLPKVFEQIRESWSPQAQKKGVALRVVLDEALPAKVVGDPLRLTQVLTNLVSNAIKFTDKGEVGVFAQPKEDGLYVEVRDTGTGIPREMLPHIFDLYTQAGTEISRKYGGTGLGLSITKSLVELQGGEIGVSSEPGQGSVFWFRLPIEIKHDGEADSQAPIRTLPEGIRILLVDDDRINQLITKRLLAGWGVKTTSAANGEEALTILQEEEFDLVLMDLQMPVMDGRTAVRRFREQEERGAHLPVIALTGERPEGDLHASGFDDFLLKPYQPKQLKSKLLAHTFLGRTSFSLQLHALEDLARQDTDFRRESLELLDQHLDNLRAQLEAEKPLMPALQNAKGSLALFHLQDLETVLKQEETALASRRIQRLQEVVRQQIGT